MKNIFERTKKTIRNNRFQFILRILLGAFLLFSGISKIADIAEFKNVISGFHILPQSWTTIFAVVIPCVEIVLGLALIIDFYSGVSAVIAVVMIMGFTMLSAYKYLKGDISDCGCFGKVLERKTDLKLIAENLLLMFLFALFLLTKGKKGGK